MTTHAGSVSFWLIISSVPFLMLIIGLASHIPGLGREDVTDMLYSALPDMVNLHELVDSVLSNIYIDSPGTVISLSAILTLWSASSGVYRLERAIRTDLRKRKKCRERGITLYEIDTRSMTTYSTKKARYFLNMVSDLIEARLKYAQQKA